MQQNMLRRSSNASFRNSVGAEVRSNLSKSNALSQANLISFTSQTDFKALRWPEKDRRSHISSVYRINMPTNFGRQGQ